jgi:hypothetical protein
LKSFCSLPLAGRAGEGVTNSTRSLRKRPLNHLNNPPNILIQRLIPKPHHAEPLRNKPSGPSVVMIPRRRIHMLRTVELDNQFSRETNEIDHIGANLPDGGI